MFPIVSKETVRSRYSFSILSSELAYWPFCLFLKIQITECKMHVGYSCMHECFCFIMVQAFDGLILKWLCTEQGQRTVIEICLTLRNADSLEEFKCSLSF